MAKKKRYYQSKKDRMDESMGMEKYYARMRKDRMDERRGMEKYYDETGYHGGRSEGGRMNAKSPMIEEDFREFANLPRDVKMKQYPRLNYMKQGVYDSMEGVDQDINESVDTANRSRLKRRTY